MTRLAWMTAALMALPVGCTLLANNALPEDDGTAGGGVGGDGASAGTGGTASGTGSAMDGGGGTGGTTCMPTGDEACTNGLDDDCDGSTDCLDNDCADFQCEAVTNGATFVLGDLQRCPANYVPRTLGTCDDCGCSLDTPGTCTFEITLYDDPACTNAVLNHTVNSDCDTVMVSAGQGGGGGGGPSLYGRANTVVNEAPTCLPDSTSEPAATVVVCEPMAAGTCGGDSACVPAYAEGTPCILVDGDVACAPAYPNRTLVYEGGSATCDCACAGGTSSCPSGKHTHTYDNDNCTTPYITIDDDPTACKSTHNTVLSLDNHDEPLDAENATCVNTSAPSGGVPKTLCCE